MDKKKNQNAEKIQKPKESVVAVLTDKNGNKKVIKL